MTAFECVVGVLERHREARSWSDEAVARDILARLSALADEHAVESVATLLIGAPVQKAPASVKPAAALPGPDPQKVAADALARVRVAQVS